jgi:DNA-directed RNA polymerase specialized sigma24 family protein
MSRKTEDEATRAEREGAAIALCYLAEMKVIAVWMGHVLAHQILENRLHELPEENRRAILRRYGEARELAETVLG